MQKMAILQRFSRTFRENSALPKVLNVFTIGGGDIMAYPQAKSDDGMGFVNAAENKRKVISPCNYFSLNQLRPSVSCGTMKHHSNVEPVYNTIRNVAAHQGTYLANHCFHPVRYNHFGPFTPLRAEQVATTVPGYTRGFAHRRKAPSMMPDRNRNIRDHKRRLLAAKYELRRKLYKALCRDPDLPFAMRMKHRAKLSKLPRNSSFTRVHNRCILSGRAHAVYKKFRISRIHFRNLANEGALMGVKKASW